MKITRIETYTVSAAWKNWLFVKVCTDSEFYGIGEATINGFIKTTEAAVHELAHFAMGKYEPFLKKAGVHSVEDVAHLVVAYCRTENDDLKRSLLERCFPIHTRRLIIDVNGYPLDSSEPLGAKAVKVTTR